MAKKKVKLPYKCKMINNPFTKEQQEDYDRNVGKALATALYRSLEPEQIDQIINQLKGA